MSLFRICTKTTAHLGSFFEFSQRLSWQIYLGFSQDFLQKLNLNQIFFCSFLQSLPTPGDILTIYFFTKTSRRLALIPGFLCKLALGFFHEFLYESSSFYCGDFPTISTGIPLKIPSLNVPVNLLRTCPILF